jgi:hypothetical protein
VSDLDIYVCLYSVYHIVFLTILEEGAEKAVKATNVTKAMWKYYLVIFPESRGIGRTTVHLFIRLGRRGKCRRWFLPTLLFCCIICQILTAHSSSYMPINCTTLHHRLTHIRTLEAEMKAELLSVRESGDYIRVRELMALIEESVRAIREEMYTKKFLEQSIDRVMIDLGVSIRCLVLDDMTVQFPSTKKDITSITRILTHKRNRIGSLDFSLCNLDPDDVEHMVEALKDPNCKLMSLSLWNNNLGLESTKHIAKALRDPNCKLTSLNLEDNNLGPEGTKHIAKALRDPNCKLTSLSLWCNNLGLEGTKHIAKALRDPNCKLTSLSLKDNKLGFDGVELIVENLTDSNCKLTSLDLRNNDLDYDEEDTIESMIKKIQSTGRELEVIL